VGKGAGGFLNFTAGIGDFLRSVDDALTKGDALKGFFDGLSAVLKVPFNLIISLAKAIGNLFTGDSSNAADNFNNSIDAVNKRLGPFKSIIDTVGDGMHKLAELFSRAKQALEPWFSSMADKAKDFGDSVAQALGSLKFDQVMSGLQTGLMAGIFVTLKNAFAGGAGGGLISSIKGTLGGVNEVLEATTGKLKAMEQEVKAKSLLEIAASRWRSRRGHIPSVEDRRQEPLQGVVRSGGRPGRAHGRDEAHDCWYGEVRCAAVAGHRRGPHRPGYGGGHPGGGDEDIRHHVLGRHRQGAGRSGRVSRQPSAWSDEA
jgi:hypothetical protein